MKTAKETIMGSDRVDVHFACNHGNGQFSGRAVMFEFHRDGALELVLDHADLDLDSGGIELTFGPDTFEVMGPAVERENGGTGRHGVRVPFSNRHRYVGNMAWDACSMPFEDALNLARFLLAEGGFTDVELDPDGPFADLEAQVTAMVAGK